MIPRGWIDCEEAKQLGYKPEINYKVAIKNIDFEQPFISFALSNINKDKLEYLNIISIRLDGPMFRLRLALFKLILVGLCQNPVMGALLSLSIELAYFFFLMAVISRYFYVQSWWIIVSRINISVSIIFITSLALYLSIAQAGKDLGQVEVNRVL